MFEGTKWEKKTDDTFTLAIRPGEMEGATFWFRGQAREGVGRGSDEVGEEGVGIREREGRGRDGGGGGARGLAGKTLHLIKIPRS